MSIANSVRGLSDEAAAELLKRGAPALRMYTQIDPFTRSDFEGIISSRKAKKQDAFEDFGWVVPDLGAGGEW